MTVGLVRQAKEGTALITREVLGIIADNLHKAGWSYGCVSAVDRDGRTIWIADAYRGDGKRFVVRTEKSRHNYHH